jgi:hypothetical protein
MSSVTKLGHRTAHTKGAIDMQFHSHAPISAASSSTRHTQQHQHRSVHSRKSDAPMGKRAAVSAAAGDAAARSNTKLALLKKQKLRKQEQEKDDRSNIKSVQKLRKRDEDEVDAESVSDGIKGADELAQEMLRAVLSQRVAVCCISFALLV